MSTRRRRNSQDSSSDSSSSGWQMEMHPDALYYHTALEALATAKLISAGEFVKAGRALSADEVEFERKMEVVTAIVFSAMCLEAFINERYAALLSPLFEQVERFPLESKWLMLPLLLGNAETFAKGAEPFQTFVALISTRNNRLVHFKPPRERRSSETRTESHELPLSDLVGDISTAEKYFECVKPMIEKLDDLTKRQTGSPKYLSGSKYVASISSYVKLASEIQPPPVH